MHSQPMEISDEELSPGERWYAVHALPYKERSAALHLRNQGFRPYLPLIRKTRRHARKLDTVLTPLFPRYLFVALNIRRDQWRSVNGTYGVARLVMQHDRPLPVPEGVVEQLLYLTDSRGCVHFDRGHQLHEGQKVLIEDGPLADQFAIIERLDGKGRAALLLELMGREARVRLPVAALRPVR